MKHWKKSLALGLILVLALGAFAGCGPKEEASVWDQEAPTREAAGKGHLQASVQRRYYLCSMKEPARIAQAIREHWRIENQQHWVLDVQFGEDAHRARKDHSAANLAVIRRAALNLLRDNDSSNVSMRRRKMRAGSSQAYRQQILFGQIAPEST